MGWNRGVRSWERPEKTPPRWFPVTLAAAVVAVAIAAIWLVRHRELLETGRTSAGWVRRFRDGDPAGKAEAARSLASIGPRAAAEVAGAMGNPDVLMRRGALTLAEPMLDDCERILGVMSCYVPFAFIPGQGAARAGYPVLQNALIARLDDPDPEVRRKAARLALRHVEGRTLREQAANVLRAALLDPDPAARIGLIEKLCRSANGRVPADSDDAILPLADAARDPDPKVRLAAVEALARGRSPGAVSPLFSALKDADEAVRRASIRGLLDALKLRKLGHPELVGEVRAALPSFLGYLSHGDPDGCPERSFRRAVAIRALGVAETPEVVPKLMGFLDDVDDQARRSAASSLAMVSRDPRALAALKRDHLPALISAVDAHILSDSKESIAEVLGRIGPDAAAAVPKLLKILRHPWPEVRKATLAALAAIAPSSGEVQNALRGVEATDPDPTVREAARHLTDP